MPFWSKKPSTPTSSPPPSKGLSSVVLSKGSSGIPIYDTGRNVDDVVMGLIMAMNDGDQPVKDQIQKSLERLGMEEPRLVIAKCLTFLAKVSRSQKTHRVLVMKLITFVLDENEDLQIPKDLASAVVRQAISEIVAEKSISSEWQNSANVELIAASRLLPEEVGKQLLEKFPQSKEPHYFIVKSLADFAHKYPHLFLPFLKEVLSRTLPLLAMLKQDNMKWVFSAALGRWAEAVVRCTRTGKTSIPMEEYAASMHTAITHSLQEWITSKQSKIRLASCEGIGYMAHIIETEHLRALYPKIIPNLMKLQKKEAKGDQYPVSVGLRNVLYVVMKDCPELLEEHVDGLLTSLHTYVINSLKLEKYPKNKENRKMLLQSLQFLFGKMIYTEKIITFLQKQLSQSNTNTRIGTMNILEHLVDYCDDEMSSFKEQLVTTLNVSAKIDSIPIHNSLACLVRKMGENDYLVCPGGHDLVQVIVKGCSISDGFIKAAEAKNKGPIEGLASPKGLRELCDEIMIEFSSGEYATDLDETTWPFLLESFTPAETDNSFAILCRAISDIAKRKKTDDDFIIDFDKQVNLPKPDQLLARLIVKLAAPFERNNSGVNILRTLYCLSPNLHHDLVELWSKKLPQMKKYLDNEDDFDQDQWENMILSLLRGSMEAVDDDQWNVSVGDALLQQCSLYQENHHLKKVLLCQAGLVVQKTNYKEFVVRGIAGIFSHCDHMNDEERLGCARGLGQAAQTHTDSVLTKLNRIISAKEQKKGWGFGKKDTSSIITAESKATALLAYGYLSRLTPVGMLKPRMEVHIINVITPLLKTTKTFIVQVNALKCLKFIATSVHPSRVDDYILKSRDTLIRIALELMAPTPPKGKAAPLIIANNNKLTNLGLEALTALTLLPPKQKPETQEHALKLSLRLLNIKNTDESIDEGIIDELYNLLSATLAADMDQGNLDDILDQLTKYLGSQKDRERTRSSATFVYMLNEFAKGLKSNPPEQPALHSCGKIIGRLVPRISEPIVAVRSSALDSIYLTLRIQFFIASKGNTSLPEPVQQLAQLRTKLDTTDPGKLLKVVTELAHILSRVIAPEHLRDLLMTLIETLADFKEDGANGSAVVLKELVRLRGKEMENEVNHYVKTFLHSMAQLKHRESIVQGLLISMKNLTTHFPMKAIKALRDQDVPHSDQVVLSFQQLAKDKKLLVILLDNIIELMNDSQLYDERVGKKDTRQLIGLHDPLSATAALHAILEEKKTAILVHDYYHKLVPTIMLRIGSSNFVSVNPPVADAHRALKNFLICAGEAKIVKKLEENPTSMDKLLGPDFPEGVQAILQMICEAHPELVRKMFDFIQPYVNRTYMGQKIAATCCISVLLKNIENDREMVNEAINCLLTRSGMDEPVNVKIFAIRGLATMSQHPKDILHKFLTPVMTILISCIEDRDESIILETMSSIQELFSVAEDEYVAPLLINLCIRLKPSFEKPNPQLRTASIKLFGTLGRFAKGVQGQALLNNIYQNLPTLLLHLQDPEKEVVDACQEALANLVPQLGSDDLAELIESYEPGETNFREFSESFAKIWVKDFNNQLSELTMNMVKFFESQWPTLVCGAVHMMGYMVANMNEDQRKRSNLRHTCTGIVKLLKSQHKEIRLASSRVLGLFELC